jgi:hypothetical protein|nr:MAG TPA: Cell Wall Hydrolase [Caudoviricetes sp.]DAR11088.1 MAG TPA: Cell Wall Hydrolase [Bacteriophage sp.]
MKEKIINISATLAGISLIALILRPVQPQAKINQQSAVLSECYNSHVDYKVETGEISVDEYELSLMAHLLMGECGATCNDDEMLYLAGAVVLNRVQSEYFPNSIEEVIYQPGQYQCTELINSGFYKEPTERCWRIAEELLISGYDIPSNVLYQAEFKQGSGVYKKVQNMYFCYK